jgi:RNA polymerase sigma-54 factor
MGDRYGQIQEQRLEQKLGQTISHQQMLQSALMELPIAQLADRINLEMNDNPALEAGSPNDVLENADVAYTQDDADAPEDYTAQSEREERQSALDAALEGIGRDDEELPVYHGGSQIGEAREEIVYGASESFYDLLKDQMGVLDLTEHQQEIMEYLIGSLDDDGLLRKSLSTISDELAIYHNIDATEQEIEAVLLRLQEFDPVGIGARSLQECLLIQIARRDDSKVKQLMQKVVTDYFDDFTRKHWQHIQRALSLTDEQAKALFGELRRLNPRPGASMGETVGRSLQQITPDFIVDSQDDGTVSFVLNNGELPELTVSQSFIDSMNEYQQNKEHLNRQTKEALLYIKKKVDSAQNFIEAIKVRHHTLKSVMQAIITLQRPYFQDGDEASLRPMILKDIADRTGLDLSTVSRVCNSKYAQTRWGTFPLRHFFSDSYVTDSGKELSTRQIKAVLREIIDGEDQQHPLSDDALRDEMVHKGFPIARRTVTKYREQMGIPVARLRRN